VSTVATRPQLGFLGVGWIGRSRLDAIARSGAATVAAIADPGVEGALPSLDALLGEELDGVVIASPSALHAEQALAVLERGLPVFCQKPLALDAASTRAVVDAARRADVLLGVDLSYRHTAAARAVLEAAASIGEPVAAELVFHNAYGPDKAWFYEPELSGGGCLLDLGVHLIDLALALLPGPPRVLARSLHGSPVEDLAVAQLEIGGVPVRLACSWRLHAGRECVIEATVYGTEGGVSLRNVDGSFYDLVAERYDGTETTVLAAPPDDWPGRAAVEWAQRVAEGERFDPAAERLVAVAETIDAIYGRDA
jgi:predicted dehydrogenase